MSRVAKKEKKKKNLRNWSFQSTCRTIVEYSLAEYTARTVAPMKNRGLARFPSGEKTVPETDGMADANGSRKDRCTRAANLASLTNVSVTVG